MHTNYQIDPHTPVLIGAGQHCDKEATATSPSAGQIVAKAVDIALAHATESTDISSSQLAKNVDTLAMVRYAYDTMPHGDDVLNNYQNPPHAVAQASSLIEHTPHYIYNEGGGSSGPKLLAQMCERIANNQQGITVLAGGEALATQAARLAQGMPLGWDDSDSTNDDSINYEAVGTIRSAITPMERKVGLQHPVNCYPLYATALAHHYNQSIEQHVRACAEMGSEMSKVAAKNPYAWFKKECTVDEIATVNEKNRWIGFPYPKLLNSIMSVNMSAALVLCSYQDACDMGIPQQNMVFIHGVANLDEVWNITARVNYFSAPAIGECVGAALDMAGKTIEDIDLIDLYSCFPCAVQTACDALHLDHNDKRGLTVTGGLPYFGGPGNNYATHALAELVVQMRGKPETWGLSTGNGWYLTKHSAAVLSNRPFEGQWKRINTSNLQHIINAQALPTSDSPEGVGIIETYTVTHQKAKDAHTGETQNSAKNALIIGRMKKTGLRFAAKLSAESADHHKLPDKLPHKLLDNMKSEQYIGRAVTVTTKDGASTCSIQ